MMDENEEEGSNDLPFPKSAIVLILMGIVLQYYNGGYDGFAFLIGGLFLFVHWLYLIKKYK